MSDRRTARVKRFYVLDVHTEEAERFLDELTDRVGLARSEDEILCLGLLQHPPHALNVVTG